MSMGGGRTAEALRAGTDCERLREWRAVEEREGCLEERLHCYGVHAEDLVGFTIALDVVEGVGYAGRGIVHNTALAWLT